MAIQSVQRALNILELFSMSQLNFKLTEIANELNLNVATAHGIVSTLEQNGFLKQDPRTKEYQLGAKLYELGRYFASNLDINLYASARLHQLMQKTNSPARVGIWDNNTVLITLYAYSKGSPRIFHNFSPRIIPYCTAIGKAIMAYMSDDRLEAYLKTENLIKHTKYTLTDRKAILSDLAKTRKRGYAINRSEMSLGRAGIAAPIWGKGNVLEGAISIPLKDDESIEERSESLARDLLRTTFRISQSMGYSMGEPDRVDKENMSQVLT